jgi:hypothetical protein
MSSAVLLLHNMDWASTLCFALFAFITVFLVYTRYCNELRNIPGPFLASILPLDRILSTAEGHQFSTHIEYHKRYGPLVRIGPNHVSFSDAEAIPLVYSISTKFFKVSHGKSSQETDNSYLYRATSTVSSMRNHQKATSQQSSPSAMKPPTEL